MKWNCVASCVVSAWPLLRLFVTTVLPGDSYALHVPCLPWSAPDRHYTVTSHSAVPGSSSGQTGTLQEPRHLIKLPT